MNIRVAQALVVIHLALVLALVAGVVGIWRIRCENFGCIGIGIAWFAWAVAFCVVLGFGALARIKRQLTGLARVCQVAWWLQLLMGAALLAVWAVKSLR
ncbi:hypothetical protein [Roseateles sp. LYH14W]|uniref:Uncharacterized protein n=1 Tax=Pelomonas parva TaxID=3299032 RepID=A0ABW7EZR9_9BURK